MFRKPNFEWIDILGVRLGRGESTDEFDTGVYIVSRFVPDDALSGSKLDELYQSFKANGIDIDLWIDIPNGELTVYRRYDGDEEVPDEIEPNGIFFILDFLAQNFAASTYPLVRTKDLETL